MFGEEWPIAALQEDSARCDHPVDRAPPARGRRLATIVSDFFLEPAERLTEQERSLMSVMLLGLVATTADEIRVRLPIEWVAATECDPHELTRRLGNAGLTRNPLLVRHLLASANAALIADAGARVRHGTPALQRWAADPEGHIAASAMALLIARGRSRDRFGKPAVHIHDLEAETAVELVYAIAAALCLGSGAGRETAFAVAAGEILARHDEGQRADALAGRLVRVLDHRGRLGDETLLELASHGDAPLLAHSLARLAQIGADEAWAMLTGQQDSPALLLRLAGRSRATAATVIATFGNALGITDPATEMDRVDGLDAAELDREAGRLRLPVPFRLAAETLNGYGCFRR